MGGAYLMIHSSLWKKLDTRKNLQRSKIYAYLENYTINEQI